MRITAAMLFGVLALSACGGPRSGPELRQARALNAELQAAAFRQARVVEVNGKTFRVATIEEGSYSAMSVSASIEEALQQQSVRQVVFNEQPYALVELVSPATASITGQDIEAAALTATGCRSTFAAGVLTSIGGFSSAGTDLRSLPTNLTVRGWRADIFC